MVFGFFSGGFDLGPFLHFLSSCSYDLSSLPNDMSEAVPNSVLSPSTFHMRQLYQSLISLSLQNLKYSLLNPALKDSSSLHNSFPLFLSSLPFCLKSWYLLPLFLSSLLWLPHYSQKYVGIDWIIAQERLLGVRSKEGERLWIVYISHNKQQSEF